MVNQLVLFSLGLTTVKESYGTNKTLHFCSTYTIRFIKWKVITLFLLQWLHNLKLISVTNSYTLTFKTVISRLKGTSLDTSYICFFPILRSTWKSCLRRLICSRTNKSQKSNTFSTETSSTKLTINTVK